MNSKITIALVGIGGYGNYYLDHLLQTSTEYQFQLVAGIDPSPTRCQHLDKLREAKIPVYENIDQFYAEGSADLVIIATPIHSHEPLTCQALAHGARVLCEKPVAATIQDAYRMAEAQQQAQRFVAIGYQWSFSDAIQALKRDVLAGEFGHPLRMRTKVFWPRSEGYFQRAAWAGKQKNADGRWTLDSPVNNATSHYLHNILYLLGPTRESSAWPVDVQAELYRANAIENYDAAVLRCHTREGVEVLFYTAHCVLSDVGPILNYEFERAVIEYDGSGRNANTNLRAYFHDGHVREYGDPNATHTNKLWHTIDACCTGMPVACGIEAAMPHILCVNGAQESMPKITDIPKTMIKRQELESDRLVWVEGLQENFEACYEQGLLPSEHQGISWARPGIVRDLRTYRNFPSFDHKKGSHVNATSV